MVWPTVFDVFSSAGSGRKVTIITLHRVPARQDELLPGEPHAHEFARLVTQWSQWFNFVTLSEAARRLRAGTLPPRAACLTFDDGYADNLLVAAPILRTLGVPGTFFVATDYMDGGMMFNDRVIEAVRAAKDVSLNLSALSLGVWDISSIQARRESIDHLLREVKHRPYEERDALTSAIAEHAGATLATQPMMTPTQVKQLADMGFEIGAHTQSHPILRTIPDERAREEIVGSRQRLQALTGQPIDTFAYPNGRPNDDYDMRHVRMVRDAGFSCAVSTIPGAASINDDLFQIPRFTPWHGVSWKSAVQFMRNYRTQIDALSD